MSRPAAQPEPRVGMVMAFRAGHLEEVRIFTDSAPLVPASSRPCVCTSGNRDRPLSSCPHCRGEGWVR